MASVIDQLENDLRLLATEAGRSLPAVREAANIAINRLTTKRGIYVQVALAASEGRVVGAKLEDVFRPFLLACNHKNASSKLIVVALQSVQRLLHADVLDQDERLHVMQVLIIQSQRPKPVKEIEVKTLQTLPLLLMPRLHAVSEDILFDAVGLCCKFYVHDPGLASAALTQILTGLFDRIELDTKSEAMLSDAQLKNAKQNANSALRLLEELVVIISSASSNNGGGGGGSMGNASPGNGDPNPLNSPSRKSSSSSVSFLRSITSSSPHHHNNNNNHHHHHHHGDGEGSGGSGGGVNVVVLSSSPQHNVRQMPKSTSLELLETILSSHAELFLLDQSKDTFAKFVRERVFPVLVRSFGGRCDWRLMVRMMRTVVVLLVDLRPTLSGENVRVILALMLQMLDDNADKEKNRPKYVTPLWHRVLTLETLNTLCSHQDLLRELQQVYIDEDSESREQMFIHIVRSLCNLVGEVVREPKVAAGIDAIAARPTKGLDLLSEEEPPSNLSESLVTLLAAECLASIADGMAVSQGAEGARLSPVVQIGKVHSRGDQMSPPPLLRAHSSSFLNQSGGKGKGDFVAASSMNGTSRYQTRRRSTTGTSIDDGQNSHVVREMMLNCWKPMLQALALLLQSCNNENVVQFILKAYMSMTNTCGVLGLVEARNAFILSLCNFSLPNWHSSATMMPQYVASPKPGDGVELQPKHIQSLKALFNIAHGLGSILGTAWHIVLETFEQLDHIMFCVAVEKKLTTSGTVHVTGLGPSSSSSSSSNASSGEVDKNRKGLLEESNASEWHLIDDEMAIVESMLRFLFNSTKYLDEEALIHMQTALTQLSFTVLAHNETMRNSNSGSSRSLMDMSISSGSAAVTSGGNKKKKSGSTPPAPQVTRQESSSWISSITSSIADTLNTVTYDGDSDEDDDIYHNDEDDDNESLGIDLTLEDHESSSSRTPTPPARRKLIFGGGPGGKTYEVGESFTPPPISSTSSSSTIGGGGGGGGGAGAGAGSTGDNVISRVTYRNPPFAIEKLVETTKLNIFRVNVLWEMTQNVLSTVASKSDAKLRLFGVQAMEDLVTRALLFDDDQDFFEIPPESKGGKPPSSTGSQEPNKQTEGLTISPPSSPSRKGMLSPVTPEPTTPKNSNTKAVKSVSRRGSSENGERVHYPMPRTFQKELVEGFSHLFQSHHLDAREAASQSLYRIIGTCGHVLDDGWVYVIDELFFLSTKKESTGSPNNSSSNNNSMSKKKEDDAKLIPSAFKAVQLIVDDFLSNLSFENKKKLARCIRAFGEQEPHVNISLTAITMLWSMCDHIQKECPDNSNFEKQQEIEQNNALLLYIFEQLCTLSVDERPEVRNCAVRTLCSIIVACGSKLTMESWRICNMGVLFPLLEQIITKGSMAQPELVRGEVLGRLSGERTRVHHSLDTLEKQWRETIVTAIHGATRVVRATIQFTGHLDWAKKSWEIMLGTIRSLLQSKPKAKVALAATRSLQELAALVTGSSKPRFAAVGMQVVNGALVRVDSTTMQESTALRQYSSIDSTSSSASAVGGGNVLPAETPIEELWKAVWDVYENITARHSEGLVGVDCIEVATDLVNGIGELYGNKSSTRLLRTFEHLQKCLLLISRLLDSFPANSKHITGLERAVLGTIELLPPAPDSAWSLLFNQLRLYMMIQPTSEENVKKGITCNGYSLGFAEKSRQLFVKMFEKNAPSPARAIVFEDTVNGFVMSGFLLAKGSEDDGEETDGTSNGSWNQSSLVPIFQYGLRALAASGWSSSRIENIWMKLLHALSSHVDLCEKEEKSGSMMSADGLVLLNVVMEEARPLILASCVPQRVQDELFRLLVHGCKCSDAEVSRACLDHLLTISTVMSSEDILNARVFDTLILGIEQACSSYLVKDETGSISEEDENNLVSLLVKLGQLEMESLPKEKRELFHQGLLDGNNKCHLLILFPMLTRFIPIKSDKVRIQLQELFQIYHKKSCLVIENRSKQQLQE